MEQKKVAFIVLLCVFSVHLTNQWLPLGLFVGIAGPLS